MARVLQSTTKRGSAVGEPSHVNAPGVIVPNQKLVALQINLNRCRNVMLDRSIVVEGGEKGSDYVWVELKETAVFSCYPSPNDTMAYTFVRGESGSISDITTATEGVARKVKSRKVLEEEQSLSDHKYIEFELQLHQSEVPAEGEGRGWILGQLNKEKFKSTLRVELGRENRRNGETVAKAVIRACDAAMPRKEHEKSKRPEYWWTEEIARLRGDCIAREGAPSNEEGKKGLPRNTNHDYKEAKRRLRDDIKKSKRRKWKEVCSEIDEDVCRQGYRIAIGSNALHPRQSLR